MSRNMVRYLNTPLVATSYHTLMLSLSWRPKCYSGDPRAPILPCLSGATCDRTPMQVFKNGFSLLVSVPMSPMTLFIISTTFVPRRSGGEIIDFGVHENAIFFQAMQSPADSCQHEAVHEFCMRLQSRSLIPKMCYFWLNVYN